MNKLKLFFCLCISFCLVSCNNDSTNKHLPSGITEVKFYTWWDQPANNTITINTSSSPFTGTAVFQSGDMTTNCTLNLIFTSAQSTELTNLFSSITYCIQTCEVEPGWAGGGSNHVTFTSTEGDLVVSKNIQAENACSETNFNYFCPSATALYDLIEDVVKAASGFSSCPSEWQFTFQ